MFKERVADFLSDLRASGFSHFGDFDLCSFGCVQEKLELGAFARSIRSIKHEELPRKRFGESRGEIVLPAGELIVGLIVLWHGFDLKLGLFDQRGSGIGRLDGRFHTHDEECSVSRASMMRSRQGDPPRFASSNSKRVICLRASIRSVSDPFSMMDSSINAHACQ